MKENFLIHENHKQKFIPVEKMNANNEKNFLSYFYTCARSWTYNVVNATIRKFDVQNKSLLQAERTFQNNMKKILHCKCGR